MSTTVRLPPRIEQALASYCVENRRTKSEVIIELLERHLSPIEAGATPVDLARLAGFIGSVDEAPPAPPVSPTKARVAAAIRAKHGR